MRIGWLGSITVMVGLAGGLAAGEPPSLSTTAALRQALGSRAAMNLHASSLRRPRIVEGDFSDSLFLLPAAASFPAADGTAFRTDVNIANLNGSDQIVEVDWIPAGQSEGVVAAQYITIPANSVSNFDDFISATLGQAGLGSIIIVGVNSDHSYDAAALLDASSRIWKNLPGSAGTVSVAFPPVSVFDSFGIGAAYAYGLRQDGVLETKVGIVNFDSAPHTWTVNAFGGTAPATMTVTVPANSMKLAALPSGTLGEFSVSLVPDVDGFYWSGFAISQDVTTAGAWQSHARQP